MVEVLSANFHMCLYPNWASLIPDLADLSCVLCTQLSLALTKDKNAKRLFSFHHNLIFSIIIFVTMKTSSAITLNLFLVALPIAKANGVMERQQNLRVLQSLEPSASPAPFSSSDVPSSPVGTDSVTGMPSPSISPSTSDIPSFVKAEENSFSYMPSTVAVSSELPSASVGEDSASDTPSVSILSTLPSTTLSPVGSEGTMKSGIEKDAKVKEVKVKEFKVKDVKDVKDKAEELNQLMRARFRK